MPTNNDSSRSAAKPLLFQKQDLLLLMSALLGLIAVIGLIYQAEVTPAQAAASANAAPASALNSIQAQAQITAQNTITPLDIMVVFDISGSMEEQTICHDCWVRTSYDIISSPYPSNGYFNPIPYDPGLSSGAPNQSIPLSRLCTDPSTPWVQHNGAITYQYLTMEAELYSANVGNWNLDARTPGQGFWAIQRGSRGSTFPPGVDAADENGEEQGNQAGNPTFQSSNVCNPALPGGVSCTINGSDNVCSDDPAGNDIIRDCSAYISTRPFPTYNQTPGNLPSLNGASYNLDCFLPGPGPFSGPPFSGQCWSNIRTGNENPFYDLTGPGPSNVPWVEYDFTPTWTQTTTSIWIRAIGSGTSAFTWAGPNPDNLSPDYNGGGPGNNLSPWHKVIFWQINNGEVKIQNDNNNSMVQNWPSWRDNRADANQWRWVKLGSTATVSGTQYTLKLYQGSSGYKVDKIIFTNDPATGVPPAMRRNLSGGTESSDGRLAFGPPASYGSATREACNKCNPAYGYMVNPEECTCRRNGNEMGFGTGQSCTVVTTTTNQLQAQLENGLNSGLQPLRSAQETVKTFVQQLNPQYDQLGFVAFTANVINMGSGRTKLQCLRSNPGAAQEGTANCYRPVLSAVEMQWPNWGTNIAEGMREGLEELGISTGSNIGVDSACTGGANDKHACDRGNAAKRVLILMTDGVSNNRVTNCSSQPGYADYWNGLVGTNDPDFDCAMWYAQQAAAKGVIIYTIGIGAAANADFLTTMATGVDPRGDDPDEVMFSAHCGQYFAVAKPSDLDSALFEAILSNIRNCVLNMPVLSLTKSDSSDPVITGEVISYTLAVTNSGGISATGAIITDALDSSVSFAAASDGGVNNAGLVTWDVGVIPAGQTITRTLAVTVGNLISGAVFTNTAWLTSSEGLSYSSTATTTVMNGEQIWPAIVIGSGNTWAPNSSITLTLVAHQPTDEPFNLYFNYGGAYSQTIATNISTPMAPIAWKVPAVGSLCPISGTPCIIESRRVAALTQVYTSTNLYITQPKLVVPSGNGPYAGGETILIYLKSHTPGLAYDLKISGPTSSTYLGRTGLTNSVGDRPGPIAWILPVTWPEGFYELSSHPATNPRDLSDSTQIAVLANIQIKPSTLYLPLIVKQK